MIDDSALEVLLLDDERIEQGDALRERCPSLRALVHTGPGACPEGWLAHEELIARSAASPPGLHEHELATISYTGGTTGRPKGVMLSHGNLLANARHNLVATGHRHDDRFLHIPPMFSRRGDLEPLRRDLGRGDPGDPAALRRNRRRGDDRARADHARRAGADDAGHALAFLGRAARRSEQSAQPAVRRLAHLPRAAAPRAAAPGVRACPVLRHDRDCSHGHALHARGPSPRRRRRGALQDPPALDGRAGARRAGPDPRPGRSGASRRRDRRGMGARPERDARLLAAPTRPQKPPSSMAGTARATGRMPTATVICTWSTASRT